MTMMIFLPRHALFLLIAVGLSVRGTAADESPSPQRPLLTLADSPGISEVTSVNRRGDVVGHRELRSPNGSLRRTPYYYFDGQLLDFPRFDAPATYTNLEVADLSDDRVVVGYVSRAPDQQGPNPMAFAWLGTTKTFLPLAPPLRGTGSHAMDISDNGQVIVGYCVASDPPSMTPCIWHRDSGEQYQVTALPTTVAYNPFIQTGRVVVSPNGKLIASVVIGETDPAPKYHTMIWQREADENWKPTLAAPVALELAAINDDGMLAASIRETSKRRACTLRPGTPLQLLELPDGHDESRAVAINEKGAVIVVSEGPNAPPASWWWIDGQRQSIDLPVEHYWAIATCLNHHGDIGGYYGPKDPTGKYEQTISFVLRAEMSKLKNGQEPGTIGN